MRLPRAYFLAPLGGQNLDDYLAKQGAPTTVAFRASLSDRARQHGVAIAAGLALPAPGGTLDNALVVWDRDGREVLRTSKLFLWHFDMAAPAAKAAPDLFIAVAQIDPADDPAAVEGLLANLEASGAGIIVVPEAQPGGVGLPLWSKRSARLQCFVLAAGDGDVAGRPAREVGVMQGGEGLTPDSCAHHDSGGCAMRRESERWVLNALLKTGGWDVLHPESKPYGETLGYAPTARSVRETPAPTCGHRPCRNNVQWR